MKVCACVCVFSEPKEKQQCGDTVNTTREIKCQQITAKGTQGLHKKGETGAETFSATLPAAGDMHTCNTWRKRLEQRGL